MRKRFALFLLTIIAVAAVAPAWAADFQLLDGTIISGEVSDNNDYGVKFRIPGGFYDLYPYSKFTQDSLKQLATLPRLRPMVEPFIDLPQPPRPQPKPIVLREVPRVERPTGRTTFFSSFFTPVGLLVLALLYLANLVAGYETALYRNRPIALVCGLSALLPLLGPLIFLVSPTLEGEGGPVEGAAPGEGAAAGPGAAVVGAPAGRTSRRVSAAPAGGPALRVAAQAKAAAGPAETKVYNRGEYTFNRRFVETQFSGFFRVVPVEAEKDLVLVVRTPRAEYVGKRITRISSNEFFLQLLQTGGKEVNIGFTEIAQMIVRHKDAKDKE
jgi:hypothetical protein